jgi:hypothetical protein
MWQACSGPNLVSRNGDGGWTKSEVKVPKYMLRRPHKGRRFIKTAGRWPRKSASAKKCVTTYLPNESAPKMDGAQAYYRDLAVYLKIASMQIIRVDE